MELGAILIIPAIASCLSLLPLGRRFGRTDHVSGECHRVGAFGPHRR